MKTINVHGRINFRANLVNKIKEYGLLLNPKTTIFKASFDHNEEPLYSDLIRYERASHYNNHSGYYN